MIYYSEEQKAWMFDQVTAVEKQLLAEIGEAHWASDMGYTIMKQVLERHNPQNDFSEILAGLDSKDMSQA